MGWGKGKGEMMGMQPSISGFFRGDEEDEESMHNPLLPEEAPVPAPNYNATDGDALAKSESIDGWRGVLERAKPGPGSGSEGGSVSSQHSHASAHRSLVRRAERDEDPSVTRLRTWWGTCYAIAMSVGGATLVALGSTLGQLAAECGTTATAVGTVFLARGAGAVIGAISSASLYKPPRRGNEVLVAVMLALAGVLLSVPFVRSVWLLHVTWFGLGLCTATLDTGCQIMTRKVHGLFAGPWLALNTMMFAAAGIVTPLVALATHNNVFAQYLVVASCSIVGAVALYLAPMPEAPEIACKLPPKPIGTEPAAVTAERAGSDSPPATSSLLSKCTLRFDYTTELVFSFSVFWLIGGSVSLTSYVKTYVQEVSVVPSNEGSEALLMIWVMTTVGRLFGLYDMMRLKHKSIQTVYLHLTIWQFVALVGMTVALVRLKSNSCFWVALCLYGFGNGPTIGHSYDLINRLTRNTEQGMSLVMFGLNFGASLVPYTTTILWEDTDLNQTALLVVVFVSCVLPIGLTALALALAYAKAANELASGPAPRRPGAPPVSPVVLPAATR